LIVNTTKPELVVFDVSGVVKEDASGGD